MSRKQKGGVEMTMCSNSRGRVGCYGKVECDFSGDYPKCMPQGFVVNQPNNANDYKNAIKNTLNNVKRRREESKTRRKRVENIMKKMDNRNKPRKTVRRRVTEKKKNTNKTEKPKRKRNVTKKENDKRKKPKRKRRVNKK